MDPARYVVRSVVAGVRRTYWTRWAAVGLSSAAAGCGQLYGGRPSCVGVGGPCAAGHDAPSQPPPEVVSTAAVLPHASNVAWPLLSARPQFAINPFPAG